MIAEYIFLHPNGGEKIKHRTPVNSPMDLELQRQLAYLKKENRASRLFRRVVGASDGPMEGTGNPKKKLS